MMVRRLLMALLVTTSCCSCARLDDVEKDWGETMARYKLIGVFPITEDLQPGDVLLDIPPAAGADPQPQAQRLGSLDLKQLTSALGVQDKQRLRLEGIRPGKPTTTDSKPVAEGTNASTVSSVATAQPGAAVRTTTTITAAPAAGGANRGGGAKPTGSSAKPDPNAPAPPHVLDADSAQAAATLVPRFRRVALPGIVAARVYNWQIAGAGPIGRLAIGLGLSGNGSAAVLITLRQLQMLSLDTLPAAELLETSIVRWLRAYRMTPGRLLRIMRGINPEPVDRICRGTAAPDDDARALIRVVSRVMYAHEIQYEYTRTSNVAGRFAADISQVPTSNPARPLVPAAPGAASTVQPGATTAAATTGAAIDAGNARVAALQGSLAAGSPGVPGVRATVGVGTYGNAALNETYLRPMAVGFNVAASYAVRDALVAFGQTEAESDGHLREARLFCEASADQRPEAPLSIVELIVCENTRFLARRQPPETRLALPRRCAVPTPPTVSAPSSLSTPFREIGRQRRDAQARSL